MRRKLALGMVIAAAVGSGIFAFSVLSTPNTVYFTDFGPDDSVFVPVAKAGVALDERDSAKIMRVRVSETGHNGELVLGSFSRIGFVSGSSSDFLLESVPSEDKKEFYRFVQESMDKFDVGANPTFLDVSIDIFSGDYDLINTLQYSKCRVFDYFVHAVDSRGKIPFLDGNEEIEIREVTKFTCQNFKIIIDE